MKTSMCIRLSWVIFFALVVTTLFAQVKIGDEGNIAVGYRAAFGLNSGGNNIAIGHNAQLPESAGSDQINIGGNIVRDTDGVIELKDLIRLPQTNAPASPDAGMIYYGYDNMLYCYDGFAWQPLWDL